MLPLVPLTPLDYYTDEANSIRQFRYLLSTCGSPARSPRRHLMGGPGPVPPPPIILRTSVPFGFQPILVNQIDKQVEHLYHDKILHLILTDDPLEREGYTAVLGRDPEGSLIELRVLQLPQNDLFRRMMAFGTQIAVVSPSYGITEQWRGVIVGHDKIVHLEKKRDMCRYCGKENALLKCYRCQARYCSFSCKESDRNDLDHAAVCTSQYCRYLKALL